MRVETTPQNAPPLKTTRQLLTAIVDEYVRALQLAVELQQLGETESTPSFCRFQGEGGPGEGGEGDGREGLGQKRAAEERIEADGNIKTTGIRVNIRHNLPAQYHFVKETSFDEGLRDDKRPKKHTHASPRPQNHPQFDSHHSDPRKNSPQSPHTSHAHPQDSKTVLSESKSNPFRIHIPTLGYDQYQDKTLVQYFYTKKQHLFHNGHKPSTQSLHKDENSKLHRVETRRNNFVSSRNEKRYDFKKLMQIPEGKSFEVRAEAGRRAEFNLYDLISCQKSIKQGTGVRLPSQSQQHSMREGRCAPSELLKARMGKLQSRIYSKVPCLVEMGVKFRRVKRKR